jgi:glycosyltransferase involved in cell wall biosynthesis
MARMTLVVPVFNEAEAVEHIAEHLLRPEILSCFEVVFVDDGSTDGSAEALEELCRGRSGARLLRHEMNLGYGAAIKTGILEAETDFVAITDADSSYPSGRLPDLAALCLDQDCDMVVGARDPRDLAMPLSRRPAKWALGTLADFLTQTKIPDLNSGLRIFRTRIALDFFGLICDGFSFTTTLTLIMIMHRYRVRYVPIEYHARRGCSKIRPVRDTLNFLLIIVTTVLHFQPLRVLLPPGLTLLAAGGLYGVLQAILYRDIPTAAVLLIDCGLLISMLALLADLIVSSRPVNHAPHRWQGSSPRRR